MLPLRRLLRGDCMLPSRNDSRKVVRMHRIADGPLLQFFETSSEVVQDCLVDQLDLARGGIHESDQSGNAVHDRAELVFAPAQPIFGALSIVDVGEEVVPADDASIAVTKWHAEAMEPSEYAVRASNAHIDIERVAGRHGVGFTRRNRRDVVRMHRDGPVANLLERASRVAECRLVHMLDLAIRRVHADQTRKTIEGATLMLDVRVDAAPPGDRARSIVLRSTPEEKPSIVAVGAA